MAHVRRSQALTQIFFLRFSAFDLPHSHSDRIRSIGASAHLNTTFKHLIYFINEFELVTKTEMQPLERLISKFTHSAAEREPGAAASASQ